MDGFLLFCILLWLKIFIEFVQSPCFQVANYALTPYFPNTQHVCFAYLEQGLGAESPGTPWLWHRQRWMRWPGLYKGPRPPNQG